MTTFIMAAVTAEWKAPSFLTDCMNMQTKKLMKFYVQFERNLIKCTKLVGITQFIKSMYYYNICLRLKQIAPRVSPVLGALNTSLTFHKRVDLKWSSMITFQFVMINANV